jgi:two-component system response regulator AtoC
MALLLNHSWPGNVRELENVIERAVILADNDDILLPSHLPDSLRCRVDTAPSLAPDGSLSIKNAQKSMESSLIKRALQITEGNKTKAAELLEISYPSLLSKIKEYRLTEK